MTSILDSEHIEPSSRALLAVIASLWRRRVFVIAIVAVALALGVLLVPHRYTAEAYIRGELFAAPGTVAKDDESTTAGSMSLDVVRVIETQSRLLKSHQIARRVVQQLGLERLRPLESKRLFFPAAIFDRSIKTSANKIDIAASRLLEGLRVSNDPGSYLITVRFSAEDPELAALITQSFVAELLRSAKIQKLVEQRSLAQGTLSIQLAKFGDKHPSVALAKMQLAATDNLLQQQMNEAPGALLRAAGDNVTKPTHAPSSRLLVIAIILLGSLATSIGLALWLERDRWWMKFCNYYLNPLPN